MAGTMMTDPKPLDTRFINRYVNSLARTVTYIVSRTGRLLPKGVLTYMRKADFYVRKGEPRGGFVSVQAPK